MHSERSPDGSRVKLLKEETYLAALRAVRRLMRDDKRLLAEKVSEQPE